MLQRTRKRRAPLSIVVNLAIEFCNITGNSNLEKLRYSDSEVRKDQIR